MASQSQGFPKSGMESGRRIGDRERDNVNVSMLSAASAHSRSSFTTPWETQDRVNAVTTLVESAPWRFILIFFTFVNLFGAQVRDLFIPKQADEGIDVLFTIVFAFFCIDIFLRIQSEENYFIRCCVKDADGGAGNADDNFRNDRTEMTTDFDDIGDDDQQEFQTCFSRCKAAFQSCGHIHFGSFVFWCEILATLAFLYEISFINPKRNSLSTLDIVIDPYGTPVNGLQNLNSPEPVQPELELLVVIAKSCRVARFIRSTTAVEISSKVNWYGLSNMLNPFTWYEVVARRFGCSKTRKGGKNMDKANGEHTLMRDNDWGDLSIGLSALIRQARRSDAEKAEEERQRKSLRGRTIRLLRYLGVLPNDNEVWRRQVAATKIQRAWRKVLACRHMDDDDDDDGAIDPRERSGRDFPTPTTVSATPAAASAPPTKIVTSSTTLRPGSSERFIDNNNTSQPFQVTSSASVDGGGANSGRSFSRGGGNKNESASQVGSAMRELTGQRVAVGIIAALAFTVLFSYSEKNATRPATMIVLHNQTSYDAFANKALSAARESVIPDIYWYQRANGQVQTFVPLTGEKPDDLRPREQLRINVQSEVYNRVNSTDGTVVGNYSVATTVAYFAMRRERQNEALGLLLSHIFILFVWFFGVTAFAGPVMCLVVVPIERMNKLLAMLMSDPLGFQSTSRYRRFVADEDKLTKNTQWTKEILKGMETSFLMTTILRIGSLMKVGFGSAGVEIIRQNLSKGAGGSKNILLNSQGSIVPRIFLFCDIRQFTDATESLQEEVFVFTNRIAAVVHSFCASYSGSANKNIGDAFLMSWKLDEIVKPDGFKDNKEEFFAAKSNQADKALLSVVKICMALYHNNFYTGTLTEGARQALLAKIAGRKGPVVQMGCGLHAGTTVQGAIGSQRKIDPTYVSEAVERTEFLESSTKQYGLKMLMSNTFYRLLHPSSKRRCRRVDTILIVSDDDDEESDAEELNGELMDLYTFDMDIDALWKPPPKAPASDAGHDDSAASESGALGGSNRHLRSPKLITRRSVRLNANQKEQIPVVQFGGEELLENSSRPAAVAAEGDDVPKYDNSREYPPKLVLPTGPSLYNPTVWLNDEMKIIRERYLDGIFLQKFETGLDAFYSKNWEMARQVFVDLMESHDDGPSRYFFDIIEKNGGKPPKGFRPYGVA